MAGSLNKVMLIGRLTRDPDMRYSQQGSPITTFSVATNRYSSGGEGGERREMTDYHDVVVFNLGRRNLAEIAAQYLKKASLVYIEGRLQTRSWDDQNGQKRYRTEVVATDLEFLESRSASADSPRDYGGYEPPAGRPAPAPPAASTPARREQPEIQEVDPDDIPF